MVETPTHSPELVEAVAGAIWNTWSASDLCGKTHPEALALSWCDLACWAENGKYPELKKLSDLCRKEAISVLTAAEPFIAARVEAAVLAEREACADAAKSYAAPDRFKVPASWKDDMTPSEVYNTGANDAAMWIEQEIRARGGVE